MENKSGEMMSFFVACKNGNTKTARDLLKLADLRSLSSTWEGRTCFHVAVIAGDPDLLRELAAKLPVQDLIKTIATKDKNGETALHLAVRKNHVDLAKQLVDMDANLCDCTNQKGETPLKLAVSLGFKEAVELLITHTQNALHYVVKLNQVKVVQFFIEKKLDLSKLINQPYQDVEEKTTKTTNDDKSDEVIDTQNKKTSQGGDESVTEASGERSKKKDVQKETTKTTNDDKSDEVIDTQNDKPIVQAGDTPLHIAARNKFEHMVNLLLKLPGVDKLALNSEDKTPFEIAREVAEYHESFRMIRKLAYYSGRPKPFMYCAPQVSHKKYMNARSMVNKMYEDRRNAELVVATLLAAMTCAAAFTVPGGFDSETDVKVERGSPILISYISFKLFLIFDCTAFFLSLFVCIMWEMSSELTTGDKMLFMTVNSLVVCCSFAFTAYGFIAAVYAMLALEVDTLSWVVLGSLVFITLCGILAFIRQSVHFVVRRARFHRLCGVSCFFDDFVEKVWCLAEWCKLLEIFRSGDQVSRDLITGHLKLSGLGREDGSSSPFRTRGGVKLSGLGREDGSSSPFRVPV